MNIVFDLGNVLLNFNPQQYLNKLNLSQREREKLYENIFNSEEWIKLDRGTIPQKQAIVKMKERCPELEDKIVKIMNEWQHILTPRNKTVAILKKLASANYPLYVLSNFHKQAFQYVRDEYSFFKLFDGIVISAHENCIKPEPEIYETLIQRYHINTNETVFIDDSSQNVKGAEKMGIKAIQYKNEIKLKEDLNSILKEDI